MREQTKKADDIQSLIKDLILDALRYRAIKEKIDYCEVDEMTWAILEWRVDPASLSPDNLDDAIDQILLK